MESLTQKLHPGVVVNLQKIGGCSPNSSVGTGSKDISRSNTPVAMEIGKQLKCNSCNHGYIISFLYSKTSFYLDTSESRTPL